MAFFSYYKQLDQMDCGPTCLRMVAKYYGRFYSLQTLREKTNIGKDGVSLLGIAEAAEEIGFRTVGAKLTFERLVKEAPLPCIIHWDQNHFVVIISIKENKKNWLDKFNVKKSRQQLFKKRKKNTETDIGSNTIESTKFLDISADNKQSVRSFEYESDSYLIMVADPAKGIAEYESNEFLKHWFSHNNTGNEGIVLLLEPTPLFYEKESELENRYNFDVILSYLFQHKKLLLQLLTGIIVGSIFQLIFPFLTQSIVDIGVNNENISFIYLILIAQLMLLFGRLSIDFLRSWILLHISTRINIGVLSDFIIKLMKLPVSFFDSKRFGDIMQRIGDNNRIENFLANQSIAIIFSLINLFVSGIVLATYNLNIFLIFMASSLLYGFWISIFLKKRRKYDYERFDISAKKQSNLVQMIQGMQEIKLAGAERPMRWNWERLQVKGFHIQMKVLSLSQYQQAGGFAINESKNIFITFLSAQAVINGDLSLGAMLAMQQLIGQLNGPIDQLVGFTQSIQDASISLERLNEIHSLNNEESNENKLKISSFSGDLIIKGATFQYPGAGNFPVLKNINLNIEEGKTLAIVGTSGSGKTTLLKLLLKFYDYNIGEIFVGKISFKNINHSAWRTQCGVVMQEGFIFSDTIENNITVGSENIDLDKLENAITIANLKAFINSLPLGLNTKIGAEGNGISAGQKQRILIARAVYKNPKYIFLDEATNSLDANNEKFIMESLDKFFEGKTVIVVAHRLSTVKHADKIVVLNDGYIAEEGNHNYLISKKGYYYTLVKNQLELGN